MGNKKKLIISYFVTMGITIMVVALLMSLLYLLALNYNKEYLELIELGKDGTDVRFLENRQRFYFFLTLDIGFLFLLQIIQSIYFYYQTNKGSTFVKKYDRLLQIVWFVSIGMCIFGVIMYLDQGHAGLINAYKLGIAPGIAALSIFLGFKKIK